MKTAEGLAKQADSLAEAERILDAALDEIHGLSKRMARPLKLAPLLDQLMDWLSRLESWQASEPTPVKRPAKRSRPGGTLGP